MMFVAMSKRERQRYIDLLFDELMSVVISHGETSEIEVLRHFHRMHFDLDNRREKNLCYDSWHLVQVAVYQDLKVTINA